MIETIVSETGKAYEDAQLLELGYTVSALSFWARHAERYLASGASLARAPLLAGRRLVTRWVPRGAGRRDRAVELPAAELLRRRDPGARGGQRRAPQALRADAADLAAGRARRSRECGLPDGVFAVATGGGATGEALIDLVDFVMFTGSTRDRAQGRGARGGAR